MPSAASCAAPRCTASTPSPSDSRSRPSSALPACRAERQGAAAEGAAGALGGDFGAVYVHTPGGLVLAGGHALADEVRSLELPRAFVESASDVQVLAASRIADDGRFDETWRRG